TGSCSAATTRLRSARKTHGRPSLPPTSPRMSSAGSSGTTPSPSSVSPDDTAASAVPPAAVGRSSVRYVDHPRHAEAVGNHAEPWREEGLGQRHLHLSSIGEPREHLVRARLVRYRHRQRETLEARLALAAAIGRHHHGVPDAKARVHHLVLAPGGTMP